MSTISFQYFISPLTLAERQKHAERQTFVPPKPKKDLNGKQVYASQTGKSATLRAFQKTLAPINTREEPPSPPQPRPNLCLDIINGSLSPQNPPQPPTTQEISQPLPQKKETKTQPLYSPARSRSNLPRRRGAPKLYLRVNFGEDPIDIPPNPGAPATTFQKHTCLIYDLFQETESGKREELAVQSWTILCTYKKIFDIEVKETKQRFLIEFEEFRKYEQSIKYHPQYSLETDRSQVLRKAGKDPKSSPHKTDGSDGFFPS